MNEYTYDEIKAGQTESFKHIVTGDMEEWFRKLSGDENPLHKDDEFAKSIGDGRYKSHVSFGMMTASLLSTLAGVYLPGRYSLIHSIDKLKFKAPVYVGDELEVAGTVAEKEDQLKLIIVDVVIKNQESKVVLKATMKILVQR